MARTLKRVLIVSIFNRSNFGNRLQNHAVDEILRRRGFAPVSLIMYGRPRVRMLLRSVLGSWLDAIGVRGNRSRQRRAFAAFDRPNHFRAPWSEAGARRLAQKCRLVVIGSDQIWNPDFIDYDGWEFASFSDPNRVVCLSASFGVSILPEAYAQRVKRLAKDLRAISVREESAVPLIRETAGRDAIALLDPTLLVPAEYWLSRSDAKYRPKLPFCVAYVLGEESAVQLERIRARAERLGLEVVVLDGHGQTAQLPFGPQHFLDLIRNARFVATDSFHAVVFSLIFDTEVFVFPRVGSSEMHTRFDVFQGKLGVTVADAQQELIGAQSLSVERAVFDSRLQEHRRLANQFLDENLR